MQFRNIRKQKFHLVKELPTHLISKYSSSLHPLSSLKCETEETKYVLLFIFLAVFYLQLCVSVMLMLPLPLQTLSGISECSWCVDCTKITLTRMALGGSDPRLPSYKTYGWQCIETNVQIMEW